MPRMHVNQNPPVVARVALDEKGERAAEDPLALGCVPLERGGWPTLLTT